MYFFRNSESLVSSTPSHLNEPTPAPGRFDLPPDLLPSKFTPNSLMQPGTPDILTRGHHSKPMPLSKPMPVSNPPRKSSKLHADSDSDSGESSKQDFAYISNSAKRAFFTDSESSSKTPSPTNTRAASRYTRKTNRSPSEAKYVSSDKKDWSSRADNKDSVLSRRHHFEAQDVKDPIRTDVVRRGLSLSNLLNIPGASLVTRTISHVSLCSAESAKTSSSSAGERPRRTISQVTLTFRKLSPTDSSSSSSRDELEEAGRGENAAITKASPSKTNRRSKSLPKSAHNCKR